MKGALSYDPIKVDPFNLGYILFLLATKSIPFQEANLND
jgi:hypothetical protein